MLVKTAPARVKAVGAADGLAEGEFEAIVSVFGNVDSYGDVVMEGAFTDDLAAWAAKGDPLPVIWSHDWSDPFSHLGSVVAAAERDKGLWVHGRIEDLDANPKSAQVYRLLKGRRVTQFSFAYDVLDGGWGKREDREVYELRKMHVHEVGPCLLGANQETELLAVKARQLAADVKAGRGLRVIDLGKLREAKADLDAVVAAAEELTDEPTPSGAPEGAPTDPPPAPADEEPDAAPAAEGDTTPKTGQEPDEAASTEPDGAPPAKSSPFSPAQVNAWADLLTVI